MKTVHIKIWLEIGLHSDWVQDSDCLHVHVRITKSNEPSCCNISERSHSAEGCRHVTVWLCAWKQAEQTETDTSSLDAGEHPDQSSGANTTNPLLSGEGGAGSTDFPPLASIIAPSIQDDSRADRRCLLTSTWQTNWVCLLGLGSLWLLSAWQCLITPTLSYSTGTVGSQPALVGAEGTWELLKCICQILSSSQPELSASAPAVCLAPPLTLCFQSSS